MQIQNQENIKNQDVMMRMPPSKKSNLNQETDGHEGEVSKQSNKTVEAAAPAPGEESAP